MASISSAKAAGLLETNEKIKKDDQDTAMTTLTINLEKDVKQNMIELSGEVVTHPTFYQIEGEGASGAALPTLMMVIPLMVNHATEGYTMDDENEVDAMNRSRLGKCWEPLDSYNCNSIYFHDIIAFSP